MALLTRWRLEQKRKARFPELSSGQRQRLFIALALVNDPTVIFLDELTAGLDPEARHASWDLIDDLRARGITIVLVTHAMEEAEALCDRVAIIYHGRLIALDTPGRLIDVAVCGSAVDRRGRRRSATLENAYLAMTSGAAIGSARVSKCMHS